MSIHKNTLGYVLSEDKTLCFILYYMLYTDVYQNIGFMLSVLKGQHPNLVAANGDINVNQTTKEKREKITHSSELH